MDSESSVPYLHVCPKHPFRYVAGKHKFSLRVTDDLIIIDIRFLVFDGWLLVSSIGFERCKE